VQEGPIDLRAAEATSTSHMHMVSGQKDAAADCDFSQLWQLVLLCQLSTLLPLPLLWLVPEKLEASISPV